MATPIDRPTLKEYCLKRLGKPVIIINVDDTQAEDRIDDAIQKWQEFHFNGSERFFFLHTVTAANITSQSFTLLDDQAFSVIRIMSSGGGGGSGSVFFNINYQMRLTQWEAFKGQGGVQYYDQVKQWLNLLDDTINGTPTWRFNRHTNEVHVDTDWKARFPENSFILGEGWKSVDPTLYPDVWNDPWLKAYTTALIQYQWGENLIKFGNGAQIPGGFSINGEDIRAEAAKQIEILEEQLVQNYTEPPNFFVG